MPIGGEGLEDRIQRSRDDRFRALKRDAAAEKSEHRLLHKIGAKRTFDEAAMPEECRTRTLHRNLGLSSRQATRSSFTIQ
jgi:hypothetical protein